MRTIMHLMWAMMMVLTLTVGCEGCEEGERIGLLDISAYFQKYSVLKLSWGPKSTSFDDCCDWRGVGCDFITKRVTSISINRFMYYTTNLHLRYGVIGYAGDTTNFRMNASLLLPFQELVSISLNDVRMVGCLENEGFDKLSTLVNLECLDLSYNMIDNSILSSLSTLSSLKHLDLCKNSFTTQVKGFEGLSNLRNLEYLNLGSNDLGNNILPYLNGISTLKSLRLYNTSLNGTIHVQGVLRQLEAIHLGANDVLLKGLVMFTNMKELRVEVASLCKSQEILLMTELDEIWLFRFFMSEHIMLLQDLTTILSLKVLVFSNSDLHFKGWPFGFKKLENLTIYDSTINDDFLDTIGTTMTNLKNLIITNSPLQSTISQGLCNLKNLQVLKLQQNCLIGELPQCLSNLTSLGEIYISDNGLQGNISESPLTKLFSLETIDISQNKFRIPLSLSPFFNHSRLQSFYGLGNQEIYGDNNQWMEHQPLVFPQFQLKQLLLSSRHNDDAGGYVGPFPRFLRYQTNLEALYIRDTKLEVDAFPWWLMDNNTNLEALCLVNCSLSSSLQLPDYLHHPHGKLGILDISGNNIHGTIPPHICTAFPRLFRLYLCGNKLTGRVPEQLSNCSFLEILDVSDNNLSGEIPIQIWDTPRLHYINLSSNKLSGGLSSTFISPWIFEVHLSRNRLTGALPPTVDQGSLSTGDYKLQVLDLSNNRFSGTIPKWIAGLPQLSYLLLKNNEFSGEFAMAFCFQRFKMIDVSHNYLSSHLASAFKSTNNCSYEMLNVQPWLGLDFITKRQVYTYRGKPLQLMHGIDFSSNKFIGGIPPQIGLKLRYINFLNLSHNKLEGRIPFSFSKMHDVESLDLSHNNLHGRIPPQLTKLTSLAFFDVSYNNLSGKCPKGTAQFNTFNENSYRGNPFLCCTFSAETKGPVLLPTNSYREDDDKDGRFIDMEAFYASGGVTYIMTLLIIASVLSINPRWRQIWFYYVKIITWSSYYFVVDNLPLPAKYKMWELQV